MNASPKSILYLLLLTVCLSVLLLEYELITKNLTLVQFGDSVGKKYNALIATTSQPSATDYSGATTRNPDVPLLFALPPGRRARDHTHNPYWLVASAKMHLAVTIIPKVMSSSIRAALNTIECGNSSIRCAETKRTHSVPNVSNMTRVVFLRDPFERALSAYQNSIKNVHIFLQYCKNSTQCTFEEWVDELAAVKEWAFENEHFFPQSRIAQIYHMHYHYYLRLSSAVDHHFFWHSLVHLNYTVMENRSAKSNSVLENFKKFFPTKTIQQLAEIYREDIELWEQVLRRGTPTQEGEVTSYDFYISEMLRK